MQRFIQKIVNMMKAERLFETQGGPIILSQVYVQPQLLHSLICILADRLCIYVTNLTQNYL